ncbi:type VI secretion system lipoprotein TssJ [Pseudomonas sp. CDFA 602]|uniref:type VI secretion system lipoprotein TssJ n=1 Tax=Pseudomonas californiensis TaxID=2829823 RepID=UPI001E3A216C|nr:type VI secretion system lipoprotein TssJ [Pseudomonas californiensis]MCD5994597.1 type VI secretion system lipoprotein TssJ [Pseudomonas californiensis]MCD6000041.1 type VI secretion system lipoprotein TssJ [Pseudomonas californiensis]
MKFHCKTPALLVLFSLLAGCSAFSPYSTQTRLQLGLTASDQLNPDLNGRPSPVVLRLLELKHPVAFETNDFFDLYERGEETLSRDLVISEELELRPGERVDLKLSVLPGSRYVGVLAAYRNLPHVRWRYVVQLQPEAQTRAELALDEDGLHRTDALLAGAGR